MSEGHHIIPVKIYVRTLLALLVLTVITVAVAQVDMGSPMNIIVAMLIATVKGTVVCLFFMGLKYDRPLNSVILGSSFIFLFCFFLLTFADLTTRDVFDEAKGERDPLNQIQYVPAKAPVEHATKEATTKH